MILSAEELESFSNATCAHPHGLLGMHAVKVGRSSGLVVRAFLRFVSHHSLRTFAWYRIAFGIILLAFFLAARAR